MSEITDRLERSMGGVSPQLRAKELTNDKARIVVELWREYGGKNMDGIATFHTRSGDDVTIGAIELGTYKNDVQGVEIWTGKREGPPHFRIINPPMNVALGAGRMREDPLGAIAEAISGGKQ